MSRFGVVYAAIVLVAMSVAVLFAWSPASALPLVDHHEGCKSERDMKSYLQNKHGERKVWTSQHSTGARVEIWEAYQGTTWTLLTVIAGESCIRAQGKAAVWATPRWP